MIRAFVAIGLPEEVASALIAAQAGLPAGRAVERGNLHLTLGFLGEQPEPVVEDVHYALARIAAARFELRLAGLALAGEGRAVVLRTEAEPSAGLSHLREKVVQAVRDGGIPLERKRYRPHVTLARLNAGLTGEDGVRMQAFVVRGARFRAGPFEVAEFRLMRSWLGKAGPVYDVMAEYALRPEGLA